MRRNWPGGSARRGTVREAPGHLQQDGLVTTGGARGMLRVHNLVPRRDPGSSLYGSARRIMVALIIASPRREAAWRGCARRCPLSTTDRYHGIYMDADLGFHLLLCQLSENSVLVDTWRHLEGRYALSSSATPTSTSQPHVGQHHARIVDAVEAGDAAQAVRGCPTGP